MASKPQPELRIVLVGKTGVGKTTIMNALLGKPYSPEASASSQTKKCQIVNNVEVGGQKLLVIDTPGVHNTEMTKEVLKEEIVKCITYAVAADPHVFLYVLKLGALSTEDYTTREIIQKMFGEESKNYTLAVFNSDGPDTIPDEEIQETFISEFHGGYYFFNKKNPASDQVSGLLEKINKMVEKNEGSITPCPDSPTEPELRIVLVGKTGVGKTTIMNALLGKPYSPEASASSQTKKCQIVNNVEVGGQKLLVIDTPGVHNTEMTKEVLKEEIVKCITYAVAADPHVFLYVLKLGALSTEDYTTREIIQKMFGKESKNYTLAVFNSDGPDTIPDEEIQETFISEFHGGYYFFNKKNPASDQVSGLLEKINKMVEKNEGKYYTSEMLTMAQEVMEKKGITSAKPTDDKLRTVVTHILSLTMGEPLADMVLDIVDFVADKVQKMVLKKS
ncbi:GTPase IMAP family member 8-like [Siniperca chuatsi]|uniref:GTPase IMAP family member 8-like n=1 Tax=Siniperca chuatsi TaxID=119488 RepID=UPI001CE1E297|nr:GTPase IMAP family member 8-like [Siniperca chuatsi]